MNKYLVLIVLTLVVMNVWSQNNHSQTLLDYSIRATNFTRSYPPHEKVYLHMDNRSYFLDETLWYKAYVVDSDNNCLTKGSEILHIELLSPEGAVIRTQKQRLVEGQCDGYILLDSALYSGYFEIRAYTKAMLNFDGQNYFSRVFPLFEKPNNIEEFNSIRRTLPRYRTVGHLKERRDLVQENREAKKAPNYTIKFYPEGGDLVVGLKSQVAFQIKDTHGEIVNTECYIWQGNQIVDTISSSHLGMGAFQMSPDSRSKGYVTIKNDVKKSKFPLPDALKSGCVLSVDNLSDSLKLKIRVESTQFNDTLGVAILSRGRTGYKALITTTEDNPISLLEVDKLTLRDGVNQVVIYDVLGRELLSRMIFIRNSNEANLLTIDATIQTDSSNLKPHERQEISFKLKDSKGEGVKTNFSLSIYDSTSHSFTFCQDNIYTNLLLSSEVKGFIPNVEYYFESNDLQRAFNLDMLLQVYGWSRYNWEYLSGYQKMENNYLLEKNLSIYGRVFAQTSLKLGEKKHIATEGLIGPTPCDGPISLLLVPESSFIYMRNVWNDSLISEADVITNYSVLDEKFPYVSYKTNQRGQFVSSFNDFYGETTVILTLLNYIHDSKDLTFKVQRPFRANVRSNSDWTPFILTESESSPQEKPYDYFEINLPNKKVSPYVIINGEYISQHLIDEISIYGATDLYFQPSIKTKHYMYSSRSEFTPRVVDWVYNRVNNSPLNSFETYQKKYDVTGKSSALYVAHMSTDYKKQRRLGSVVEYVYNNVPRVNASHIDHPIEYLRYYKLPLGTITTITNMTIDTASIDGYKTSVIIPKKKSIDIFQNLDYSFDSKYICYIDSTIIHTDHATRVSIHNRFKGHTDYQQYDITNTKRLPRPIYKEDAPSYVIEVFCRIEKSPCEVEDNLESFWVSRSKMFYGGWGQNISQGRGSSGWGDYRDRVIRFQGLTRMDREFYSPDYSKTPLPNEGDFRRTLYWNPNVETDSTGRANIEFYNNSTCKKYHIDAQTVTKDGEIGAMYR